ncbi:MAG: hypothetical protein R2762_14410 [Bryobacteraceae bacterium]
MALPLLAVIAAAQPDTQTRNPHGPIKIPCQNCHTTTAWRPIRAAVEFDHNTETPYPLHGMHEKVPCSSCHTQMVFANVGKECGACHADFHRRQMGGACQDCHTVRGWKVAVSSIRAHQNRFPLIGAHAAATCESCHTGAGTGVFRGLSTECVTCHRTDYERARSVDHRAASLPVQCESCHSMDRWTGARFDHNQFTRFALTGAHVKMECTACHRGGRFAGISSACFDCHAKQFNATTKPNHAAAGFPRQCETCHNDSTWLGATFDHNTATRFALVGAHSTVECASCHVDGRFAGTPQQCSGCHLADFDKTTNPNHRASNFSTQCETCHAAASWQGARFDHNLSRFRLTGAHAKADCAGCHVGGRFTGTPSNCVGCHRKDFAATVSPNHAASGFPEDCTQCHVAEQWRGATFDHNRRTTFALTGAHSNVACASCHVGDRFGGTPKSCVGCHMTDFRMTSSPAHEAAGFSHDCTGCHTTAQWKGAVFDHAKTRFPLNGGHAGRDCASCHANGIFAGTSTQCFDCHRKDFDHPVEPNHVTAKFPQDCTLCHTTSQWKGATFDHNKTKFPLTGGHTGKDCASCHVNGIYTGTPTQCSSCHLKDFQKTTNPNHVTAKFPQDCTQCHTTSQWKGATFNHSTTRFPLTGKHTSTACAQCHTNGQYTGTPSTCSVCHMAAYNATTNPNHKTAGFPTDCTLCHSTAQWKGATFNHSATRFPLTGKHASTTCAQCHKNGQFTGTPTQCSACHLTAYNATTNPNHINAKFPTDCQVCHSTTQWNGATFNHSTTPFPLTGKHTTVPCSSCHINGQYAGTKSDCYSCHTTAYNTVTNPNHKAAGFPTACQSCHTTSTWTGATFNHRFPIYSGAHRGKWTTCNECHTNPANYAVFTCTSCHQHNQTDTNKDHRGVRNYVYNSINCYQCHPQGRH